MGPNHLNRKFENFLEITLNFAELKFIGCIGHGQTARETMKTMMTAKKAMGIRKT